MSRFNIDSKDCIVMGVCSGLSKYLRWDVTLIRVGFAVLCFYLPILVAAYILVGIVAPHSSEEELK